MKLFSHFFLLLIGFSLVTGSCSKSGIKYLDISKAASYLMGSQDSTVVKWKLVQLTDPYDGGKTYTMDSTNVKILEIYPDGTFKEWDNENKSTGKYFLNKKKSAIAFQYLDINGVDQDTTAEMLDFRHQIRRFTEDSLVMAWQGRHGMVEETYLGVE